MLCVIITLSPSIPINPHLFTVVVPNILFSPSHENGSVKFWDVTAGAMKLIYELSTANLFIGQDPDALIDDFSDFKWPPYKKVSSYDIFEDDSRLAVRFIELCPFSRTLCVGGSGGQVLTFSLNLLASDVRLEVCLYGNMRMGHCIPSIVCVYIYMYVCHQSISPPLGSPLFDSSHFPSPPTFLVC